ncbi:MAG: hypothetical protein PHX14_05255, partial [Syntrophomonadaceae bacterium]|nr:hypothetical protein [Syntrophomonadaceae bacterium]
DNIPEDSDQLVEEQSELPETNDIPAMDESITAEEDRPEPIEEIITEADETSVMADWEAGRTEAEPIEKSLATLEEDMAAVAGDGFELEMDNKIENDDSEVILEEVTAELNAEPEEDVTIEDNIAEDSDQLVEEQSELPETNDIPAMDEPITAEEERPEPIEEIITEADETSVMADWEAEHTAEAEPIERSLATLEEDMAAVAGDGFELEMDNKKENNDSEVILEEVTAELNAEPEEDDTIEDNIAEDSDQLVEKQSELPEANDIPAMDELITAEEERPEPIEEIIAEADEASAGEDLEAGRAEAELLPESIPESSASLETDEIEHLDKAGELQAPMENLLLEEATAFEVPRESAADSEKPAESGQFKAEEVPSSAKQLLELIEQGFTLKEMGKWQEAGQCFMDADALTEDTELKELLNMEIINIFQLLSV